MIYMGSLCAGRSRQALRLGQTFVWTRQETWQYKKIQVMLETNEIASLRHPTNVQDFAVRSKNLDPGVAALASSMDENVHQPYLKTQPSVLR